MGAWNFDAFLLDFRQSVLGLSMTLPYKFFPLPVRRADLSFSFALSPKRPPIHCQALTVIHDRHDR